MKKLQFFAAAAALSLLLGACAAPQTDLSDDSTPLENDKITDTATEISLSDEEIKVNGASALTNTDSTVYVANDIVYYESGKDFTYGEGTAKDAHSAEDAVEHTVVHITEPGTYSISGSLSKGQIAVDLGEDAKKDPAAVVTLILNGVDITCEVAPAIIFYSVYECGSDDADSAAKDVDTSAAGANILIADGSENTVNGSYVARIYKPDSVVLNEAGTEVEDAKKLHKYDGALYSKMSMNVSGGVEGNGILTINAENEGLDSELHLTVNGGIININSGNDGINTNEDGVSVTTVNGGELHITITGETGEGDGIDSNGWLVINGGTVIAEACSSSADAGIDSDMGIHINGGTVIATGHMLDRVEDGGQTYAVFNFAKKQSGNNTVTLKNISGDAIMELCPNNDYTVLVYSAPSLVEDTYTLWSGETQLSIKSGGMIGQGGMHPFPGMMPGGETPPDPPEDMERPEGMEPPADMEFPEVMEFPEDREPPENMEFPEGMEPPEDMERPEGNRPGGWHEGEWNPDNRNEYPAGEIMSEFKISTGGNMFQVTEK